MWVKICGITRPEDAMAALGLGADAIGFVFTQSPRKVEPLSAGKWIRDIRGIEKVGVFTTEDPSYIADIGIYLGLDTIQIHSTFGPAHGVLLDNFGIIYAVRDYYHVDVPDERCRLLVDPSMGTGKRLAWRRMGIPFILSGGLTPDNVALAIETARPEGVDVSSGVEASPGIKDIHLMERFIQEAKK